MYIQNCSTNFFQVVPTLCLGTLYICKLEDMKVLLDQFTRLIDSLQSPGLRIYFAVNVIPKERNISITSGHKRVGRWCMATNNVHKSLQYQALALRPLVPLFALPALLAFCAFLQLRCFPYLRCFACLRCFTCLSFSDFFRGKVYPYSS